MSDHNETRDGMSGQHTHETPLLFVGDEVTFTTSTGPLVMVVQHVHEDGSASFGPFPPVTITHVNGIPVPEFTQMADTLADTATPPE